MPYRLRTRHMSLPEDFSDGDINNEHIESDGDQDLGLSGNNDEEEEQLQTLASVPQAAPVAQAAQATSSKVCFAYIQIPLQIQELTRSSEQGYRHRKHRHQRTSSLVSNGQRHQRRGGDVQDQGR
jgi:hypothetical protein